MHLLAVFTKLDWVVVGGYFALMFLVGSLTGKRRRQSSEEYFLGNRSLPAVAVALSFVATSLSAATFYTVPDEVYRGDITYLGTYLGAFLAVFVVALLFVPRLYRAGTVTIYGYLGQRYGEPAVIAVSLTFLFGRMLASGSRLFVAALPLCLLMFGTDHPTHKQQVVAICLIGLVGTSYTMAGGVRAVVWTDAIQLLLVIGTAGLSIGILLHRIPLDVGGIMHALAQPGTAASGASKLRLIDTAAGPNNPFSIWAICFGMVFLHMAVYGVDQDFAQRFLITKSPVRGGVSMIASQFVGVAVVSMFMLIGLLLYIFYRRPDLMGAAAPRYAPDGKPAMAYPIFLLQELPSLLSGLAIAGFFAIAQGSMDSAINAMASSAVADVYYPLRRRAGAAVDQTAISHAPRIAVISMGVLMTAFAAGCVFLFNPRTTTLLNFVLGIMTFAYAGMLAVFITALFTRRGSNWSVIAALATGVVTVALLHPDILPWLTAGRISPLARLAWPWWMPIGTGVSLVVCLMGRKTPGKSSGFESINGR